MAFDQTTEQNNFLLPYLHKYKSSRTVILFHPDVWRYDENHNIFWESVAFTLHSIIQQISQPHWSKFLMVVELLITFSEIIHSNFAMS